MENKEAYIKQWAEKLSMSEEDIVKELNKIVEEEKSIHKNQTEEETEKRALQRLAMSYRKQLRSPAIGFEGCIIAIGDLVDAVERRKREAIAIFTKNPESAIEQGLTDANGIPLDSRKEWSTGNPNRNFGKPLPDHSWLRTIYGIASRTKGENEEPTFFTMLMNGEVAKNESMVPFKSYKFRAIDKTKDAEDIISLNSSSFTTFEDSELKLPEPKELLQKYCGNILVNMKDLGSYHDANQDNRNRIAIVEGDVSTLVMEPTSVGSRRLILEDESTVLEDLESQGVTCWVPERINIDFGEQSKVIMIGRTSRGKNLDEQGNVTDEPGDIMINTFGIYVIPEYKIQPEIINKPTVITETISPEIVAQSNPDNPDNPDNQKKEDNW